MNTWYEKLKHARVNSGLSQQAVSDKLGVTRSCYAHYEQGVRELPLNLIKPLCELLDISADYLFGLTDIY